MPILAIIILIVLILLVAVRTGLLRREHSDHDANDELYKSHANGIVITVETMPVRSHHVTDIVSIIVENFIFFGIFVV